MSKTTDLIPSIQTLHKVTAAVLAVLAVAALLFMNSSSVQLRLTHLTRDDLASQTHTVFVPASHLIFDVGLKWAVFALLIPGVLASFSVLTWYRRRYEQHLQAGRAPFTWLILGGLLPGLMVEIVALLSGVTDLMVLKMMVGATFLSGAIALAAQVEHRRDNAPRRGLILLSVLTGALPWLVILTSLILTPIFGMIRQPWYAYAAALIVAAASIVALVNLWREVHQPAGNNDYAAYERTYVLTNLLAKSCFAIVLIVGLWK